MDCEVTFLPANLSAKVRSGSLLSDAAQTAGLQLALPCGGQGRCGRCLVVVQQGQVRRRSVVGLTPQLVSDGYALACQTVVESDLTVYVPPQEAGLAAPRTSSWAALGAQELVTCAHATAPRVEKYHLIIAPPSLEDNTTDFARVKREVSRQFGLNRLTTTLGVLKRLSQALRQADWDVTVVVERGTAEDGEGIARLLDVLPGDLTQRTLGIAVDIGTTTNVVYLADLASYTLLDDESAYNAQIACGEDVISRIVYTKHPGGLDHLQNLVRQTINGLIDKVLGRNEAAAADVYLMSVAGNPTMMHLFLGLDPQHIRLEPYVPTVNAPPPLRAAALGLHINPEATVDCLPGVGAYVGADITAGVLVSGMGESDEITLFIDVGTNGEIVLGNSDWLISCACSAGPAFEGAGVASGMRAAPGAIEEVWIDADTAEPTYRTIADEAPRGICGSGIISLLGELFITGIVDKGGHLNCLLPSPRVRVGAHGPEYVVVWAHDTCGEQKDIVFSEVDIENVLRAKAAIYAGMAVLTDSVGLELADIERVLIGGAFGKYIEIEKAVEIGLLPDMPWERFAYLGNTSVQGACLCLLCREHRAMVGNLGNKMTYLELSADNRFMNQFISALFLPHTDLDSFPSVQRKLQQVVEP